MDSQIFSLPAEMNNVLTATIVDSINGDILFCHDHLYLYAAKITKVGGSVIFQRFSLPNLIKLIPVIKNYFIALFSNSKLNVFEVWFNEEGKVMLKYVYNKNQRQCVSYFLRQVVDNMAQLQVLYPENELFIYQFTVNGKMGHMDYQLGPQNKIVKSDRQQLYGSKTMVCPHKKIFYYFTNFSNKFVSSINLAKLQGQMGEQWKTHPLTYVCIPKIEEHYLLMANMMVINITNPQIKHKVCIDQAYAEDVRRLLVRKASPTFRIFTYFDMVLLQEGDLDVAIVLHIKQKGSQLIAVQYGKFHWFWTATRKLVGFSPSRNSFKMIDNLKKNKRPEQVKQQKKGVTLEDIKKGINRPDADIFKFIQEHDKEQSKEQYRHHLQQWQQARRRALGEKDEEEYHEKFVPRKIIQKRGVNMSKTINKPKQIQPMMNADPEGNNQQPKSPLPDQVVNQMKLAPQFNENDKKVDDPDTTEIINQQEKQILDIIQAQSPQKPPQIKNEEKIEDLSLESKKKIDNLLKNQNQINQLSDVHWKQQNTTNKQQNIQQENNAEVKQQKENDDNKQRKSQENIKDEKAVEVKEQNTNNQEKQQGTPQEDSLYKNLSILIQKRSMGAIDDNLSQINRNKIFQTPTNSLPQATQTEQKYEFYNPLTSSSPLQISKSIKKVDSNQQENNPVDQISNKETKVEPKSTQDIKQIQNQEKQIYKPFQLKNKKPEEEEPSNIEIKDLGFQDQEKRNQVILAKIKQLFQDTTIKLTKTLDEVAQSSTIQPYLKKGIIAQIQEKVMSTLKRSITGQFTAKIESFFKQIFRQTSQVQQESICFYKQAVLHKSGLIEVQLFNQQKILKDVKEIQNMIRVSVAGLRSQSYEVSENLIRQWRSQMKQTQKIVENLQNFKTKMEEQAQKRNKRYDETKKQLEMIKNMLQERVNEEQQKKQKSLEEQSLKLQQQQEKRKNKAKKAHKKSETQKEKKVRLKRLGDI